MSETGKDAPSKNGEAKAEHDVAAGGMQGTPPPETEAATLETPRDGGTAGTQEEGGPDPQPPEQEERGPESAEMPAQEERALDSPQVPDTEAKGELAAGIGALRKDVQRLNGHLDRIEKIARESASEAGEARRLIGFLPSPIRQLSAKVEGIGSVAAEPRCRELIGSMIDILNMVDNARKVAAKERGTSDGHVVHQRNYEVLHTQILQILQRHGVEEAPAKGAFDPKIHRPVETVPCSAEEESGQIAKVLRSGFRTETVMVRYPEVAVTKYEPPPPKEAPPEGEAKAEAQPLQAEPGGEKGAEQPPAPPEAETEHPGEKGGQAGEAAGDGKADV